MPSGDGPVCAFGTRKPSDLAHWSCKQGALEQVPEISSSVMPVCSSFKKHVLNTKEPAPRRYLTVFSYTLTRFALMFH